MAVKSKKQRKELPRLEAKIQPAPDMPDEIFRVPLDGKLITSSDPCIIGKNFKALTNLKYADTHPEGILGMTKINSTALTGYLKTRNAFQLLKKPVAATAYENHLLAQVYNTGLSASVVIQNETYVPSAGDFSASSLWTDSSGAGYGMFSLAPIGHIAYCNGVDSCIWSGDETICAAFITSTATLSTASDVTTNPKDFTEVINNAMMDQANSVNIGGGVDAYTVLMLHFNEASGTGGVDGIQDSSSSDHTITAVGGAATSSLAAKFGICSLLLDGTDDYLTVPDHANWYFGADPFTIDTQIYVKHSAAGAQGICGQHDDGNNYWYLTYTTTLVGSVYTLSSFTFKALSSGAVKAEYTWTTNVPLNGTGGDTPFHIEFSRNGSELYLFIDGVLMTTVTIVTAISTNQVPNLNAVLEIGTASNHTLFAVGYFDEFRISKGIARNTVNFYPPTAPYSANGSGLFFVIGSTRPASGVKVYISSANSSAAVLGVKEFNGSSWVAKTILSDGTAVGGIPLAQTGIISWGDTIESSKQKYLDGYYLYFYLVSITAGEATIYHATMDVPFQNIIDIWDGYYRNPGACFVVKATTTDVTINVRTYEYLSEDASTYANINSLTATTQYIEAGFTSRQTGLFIAVPDQFENTTASTSMAIYYWNGATYVTVGTISDGTSSGSISLKKSGVVTWHNNNIYDESKKSIEGSAPLYYYKIVFSQNLDSTTRIFFIGGIPTSETIKGYSFSIHASDRLMLGGNTYQDKNALMISGQGTTDVFNGTDSYRIFFGDDNKLTCGCTIFTQYSSSVYNFVLVYKATETWSLLWNQTSDGTTWSRYRLSPNIGCSSPKTLCVASVIFENNINQAKVVAMWRGNNGIFISNGQAPFDVSGDIRDVFDQSSAVHVNASMIENESGFFDKKNSEYHWLWASGSSTTLDKEYVLDLRRWKWYEIDRGTGKRLQCGVDVVDTIGNHYTYGAIDSGYLERLENGTDFDGTDITGIMHFGDQVLVENNIGIYTDISKINLVAKAKNTDSNVTMTLYQDGAVTGTNYTISMADATHSYANVIKDVYSLPAIFQGLKFVTVSGSETKGFEPLYLNIIYKKVREHTR